MKSENGSRDLEIVFLDDGGKMLQSNTGDILIHIAVYSMTGESLTHLSRRPGNMAIETDHRPGTREGPS